jgi:tetratricopeptide (TPR) repeat protein
MAILAGLLLLSAGAAYTQSRAIVTAALPAEETGKARIWIPGVKGVLEMDVGASSWKRLVRSDGLETKLEAMERPDNLLITAFLQKVNFSASAENCRKDWWPKTKKNPLKRENLRETDVKDGIARVEFVIHRFRDAPVEQKNIHAYLGSGNLCAEVHLSKVQFQPEDQKLFEDVLSTVHLLPDEKADEAADGGSDALLYVAQGSQYYLKRDFHEAAKFYQKALDLEKQKRTLPSDVFRVLVDNLGMAYGISGKLDRAKETLAYGIAQDPEYPMFYYNMACTYGEMDKMEAALEQLRLAYKYRANMIAGEGPLPNPLTDDSFRKFVGNETFVQAVREMQKP